MKQRIFTLLFALLSMVTSAWGFTEVTIGGISYRLETYNHTADVAYQGYFDPTKEGAYTGDVVIPQSITYQNEKYDVTSIGFAAFYNCRKLTSITIPNSVTSIEWSAFYNCRKLTSITIPNSVTSIDEDAFRGCSNLTSINIPDGVTQINEYTFDGCSSLTTINIPNNVTFIGRKAFRNCSNLTSITIPSSVTTIESEAFYGCSGVKSFYPKSVVRISPFRGIAYNILKISMLEIQFSNGGY